MFTSNVRFVDGIGAIVIRSGAPDKNLTVLYAAALVECDQRTAQAMIRIMTDIEELCQSVGTTWQGSKEDIQAAICRYLEGIHKTEVYRRKGHARVYSSKVNTIKTALAHLTYGYELAERIGLYEGCPLIGKGGYGYFRVPAVESKWRENILDNPLLPEIVRKYGKLANITQAEMVVYETLLCSGARISEVCSINLAGARDYVATQQIGVRNKWDGPDNTKVIPLSTQAVAALETYIDGDLKNYDPDLIYLSKNGKNKWTMSRHIQFLESAGIDYTLKPLFYNRRANPLNSNAFRYSWMKIHAVLPNNVKNKIPLVASLHDFRRWYINAELDKINSTHQHYSSQHVSELKAFIARMGWRSYLSLAPYDYRKIAMRALERDNNDKNALLLRTAQVDVRTRRAQLDAAEAAGLGIRSREI